MKAIGLSFLFYILFTYASVAQTTYTWTGAGATSAFEEPANWTPIGIPAGGDNIIFDNTGAVSVIDFPSSLTTLGSISLMNNSDVTFLSIASISVLVNLFEIDNTSSFTIDQSIPFQFTLNSANINGQITLDGAAHVFTSATSVVNSIQFNSGSSFTAGTNLTGFPFGDSGIHSETVFFADGSNYYHEGGLSPFGSIDFNVVTFSPESNYFIKGGDGSNIYFSGKTYGNIINDSGNDIIVPSTASSTVAFSFNTMTAMNGGITFNGTIMDGIEMLGSFLEASGGNIYLNSGTGFLFSNLSSTIRGDGSVTIACNGTAAFMMLDYAHTIFLENDLNLNLSGTADLSGILECNENSILIQSGTLSLFDATVVTQHSEGIEIALQGSFNYNQGVTFSYTENVGNPHPQSTGLINHTSAVGTINISNPQGVYMDNTILVDFLNLNTGFLQIGTHTLAVNMSLNVANGYLEGDLASSVLKLNGTGGSTSYIPVPLNLFELDILGGINELKGSGDLTVNIYYHNAGDLYLIEAGMIVLNTFNHSGGNFYGGELARLTLGSDLSTLNLAGNYDMLDFGALINQSSIPFVMPTTMTIFNILEIGPSNFVIGSNTLILNGTCGCSGGVFESGTMSNIQIGGNGDIALYFSPSFHTLYSMTSDRDGIVDIFTDLNVDMNLYINQGKIRINNANLRIPSYVSISGTNSYIITGANGRVTSGISGTPTTMTIPIGTELYYAPITLSSSGLEFTVAVIDSVYTEGYSGLVVSDTRIINHTWLIGSSDETLPYNLTFSWNPEMQGVDFNQANVKLFNIGTAGSVWTEVIGQNANAAITGSYSVEQLNSYGLFMLSSAINQAPVATTPQEFSVDEHSPAGTVVGQLAVSDSDPGQTLSFVLLSAPDPNPFTLDNALSIIVSDPLLINYAVNPVYNFKMNVCDNGIPSLCTPLDVVISVNDVSEELMIANYFSPNNDNINDTWIIQGARLVTTDVKVFNNFGTLVYQSSAYQNDWNGISNGTRLPPGVYIYIVRTPNAEFKGTLTLAR